MSAAPHLPAMRLRCGRRQVDDDHAGHRGAAPAPGGLSPGSDWDQLLRLDGPAPIDGRPHDDAQPTASRSGPLARSSEFPAAASRRLARCLGAGGAIAPVVLAALAATCAGGPALVGPSRHVRSAITRLAGRKTGTACAAGALRATTPGRSACTVTTVLSSWPLTRLAAQTIVVPAHEGDVTAVAPEAREAFGGVILFGSSAPADLGSGLAALRRVVPYHLGLLVMTDEEGGGIQRMAKLVGNMPWPSQMGATMTPGQIRALTRSIGSKMSRAGVNVDLAPVLDVDGRAVFPGKTDPDGFRSFSGTMSVVSADGVAYLRGLMQGQVLPVAKHFPGLGGASGNTDDGPASTLPWATLQRVALPPFEAAIKAGVPAIMVSNAWVPGLTRVPASLSYEVVTRQLRDGLGFKGLIVTDSLSVPSISALGLSVPQAAVEALEAGDDMILYNPTRTASRDLALANGIDRAIVAAVDAKRLSKAALVAAAAQVLAAKKLDVCSQAASSDRAASRFRHNRCVERAASARQDRGRTRDEPRVPERQPEPLQEPVGRPEDGGGQHEPRRHPDRGRRDRGLEDARTRRAAAPRAAASPPG